MSNEIDVEAILLWIEDQQDAAHGMVPAEYARGRIDTLDSLLVFLEGAK